MATSTVIEHTISCSHIREYPHATINGSDPELFLAVKQYIPHDGQDSSKPRKGCNLIAFHANGIPKEAYEPLWEETLQRLNSQGVPVKNIWIADQAYQGESGVMNENQLGDDPHWFDHSRDIMHMINHFRTEMTRPLIGFAHSMGTGQLVGLANMHPRLFHSLILVEPTISITPMAWPVPIARLATFMPDRWDSKEEAEKKIIERPFYRFWDPRCKEIVVQTGLRPLPTPLYPSPSPNQYTLKTPKHTEVFNVARQNYEGVGVDSEVPVQDKILHPDVHPLDKEKAPFYRPEVRTAFTMLPNTQPSCLFIYGSKSPISTEHHRRDMLNTTGTGHLGNGGLRTGRVEERIITAGHSPPMENVRDTANTVAEWIAKEMKRSEEEEKVVERLWEGKKGHERQRMDERWMKEMKSYRRGKIAAKFSKL